MSEPVAPLRILQLVHAAQRRGAEVFARDLSAALQARGHRVETWSLHNGDGSLGVDRVLGLPERNVVERLLGVDPRSLRRLAVAVAGFHPTIIQLNGASTVKYGAALAAVNPVRPWRLVYRNIGSPSFWLKDRARRLFYRHAVMPRMDGVVALTRGIADELRRVHRLQAPVAVIPNGIASARVLSGVDRSGIRARLGVAPSTPVLAFVGALSPEKAPERFVDVVERVDGAVGWVIGDGPLRESLQARAARAGRVHFHGYVESVGSVLAGADVLVCPSDSEGIPAAVLEAGLLGVPTVAFSVGGLPDCVRDGETGMLVKLGDVDLLVDAVRELISEPGKRKALAEAARAEVEGRFTIERVAVQFEDFYARLVEGIA